MLAIELGTCRSGRTGGPPRLEACGSRRWFDPPADETLLRGKKAALGDQNAVGCDAQAGMMMNPASGAALVVAEAELLLELLVIPLDPGVTHESCVRQVQQIGHGDRVLVHFRSRATSLCSIKMTILSSRPAFWQRAARSGRQGCRAKAAAPAEPARSVLDRASPALD